MYSICSLNICSKSWIVFCSAFFSSRESVFLLFSSFNLTLNLTTSRGCSLHSVSLSLARNFHYSSSLRSLSISSGSSSKTLAFFCGCFYSFFNSSLNLLFSKPRSARSPKIVSRFLVSFWILVLSISALNFHSPIFFSEAFDFSWFNPSFSIWNSCFRISASDMTFFGCGFACWIESSRGGRLKLLTRHAFHSR